MVLLAYFFSLILLFCIFGNTWLVTLSRLSVISHGLPTILLLLPWLNSCTGFTFNNFLSLKKSHDQFVDKILYLLDMFYQVKFKLKISFDMNNLIFLIVFVLILNNTCTIWHEPRSIYEHINIYTSRLEIFQTHPVHASLIVKCLIYCWSLRKSL